MNGKGILSHDFLSILWHLLFIKDNQMFIYLSLRRLYSWHFKFNKHLAGKYNMLFMSLDYSATN